MSWSGPLFGACAVLALGGALAAALLPRPRDAVLALAVCLLGTSLIAFSLGAGFAAVLVLAALAVPVPLALGIAALLAPPAEPDRRAGPRGFAAVATGVGSFLSLALLLTRTTWPPAGGPMQLSPEWLGSRALMDHSLTFLLIAAVLSLSCFGAVALLRPRRRGR